MKKLNSNKRRVIRNRNKLKRINKQRRDIFVRRSKVEGKITEKMITLTSGLSKPNTVNNIEIENVGIAQNKNFLSLWKNGNAIKKIANGIKKNWLPPQAARLNPRIIPPEINLTNEILPLFVFMADKNR